MKTFTLTCEYGSLAVVARNLNISAAAVSKQLTRLEQELGVQLLLRSTRKVEPTEIGKSYYHQCRRILEEVDEATALISQVKSEPMGMLKVISSRYFAITNIVPYVKEFLGKFPKIELDLELAERIPDINAEGIDVMIGMSISATGDAIQKRIATTSYVLCASSIYLKKFGIPKKPQDLQKHRFITHSMRKPDNELVFANNEKVILKPYLRTNDAQTMLKLALDGMGIVKLHRYVVEEYLCKGLLKEVLVDCGQPEIPIYVAYQQRRFMASKIRCFIDFITEKMESVS